MKKIFAINLVILIIISAIAHEANCATVHDFRAGDTLWELAAKHYKDPTLFPILLRVNGIENPRTISIGTKIIIPDRSKMRDIALETDPEKQKRMIEKITSGTVKPTPVDGWFDGDRDDMPDKRPLGNIDAADATLNNSLMGPRDNIKTEDLMHVED